MAIRRGCSGKTCKNGKRCLEHLWFDVMFRGTRYRMTVNEFAVPRMEVGKQWPIESMEEAHDWERLFIGEVKAGRDPRRPRTPRKPTDVAPKDVASFLDAYVERCAKPAGLKSEKSLVSRVAVLKKYLGELPLDSLEDPDDINRFKTETLRLLAYDVEPRKTRTGAEWNREQLRKIDLRWHDFRHEGDCRLLADGVDIRVIQLMVGHASIMQTQRYLNITDDELRRGLEVSWNNKGRPLRLAAGA